MKRLLLLFCAVVVLVNGLSSAADDEEVYRVLTSADGKEIKAWIRKVENDKVTFRKDDGKIFTIPLDRLSAEDQAELKKMQSQKPATAAPVADPKVNKRLYPRNVSEIKGACSKIRDTSKALKDFTDEERQAIAELNIYRYLSGVSSDVPIDRKACEIAVRASEGCAKLGELSHDAAPEGKSCNLHGGGADFPGIVHGFVEDSGDNNRSARGHRMWCLHPNLPKSGFGCDQTKQYSGMWVSEGGVAVSDKKRKGRPLEFHAYPGNGFYPVSRLHGAGWSIYPGSSVPDTEPEIKIYELASRPVNPLNAATMPKDAREIKIGFQKFNTGQPGWVVFEPDITPAAGKIYWVSFKSGAVRFGYVVEFIDLEL